MASQYYNPLNLVTPQQTKREDEEPDTTEVDAAVKRFQDMFKTTRKLETPATRTTARREREEEELNDLGRAALKGMFTQDVPTLGDFNKAFRNSFSPAREVMANFFRGFASGSLGQKYTSLRDEKLNEFNESVKAAQEDAKNKANLAVQALQEIRMARQQDMDRDYKNIENEQDDNKRRQDTLKFAQQYGWDKLKFQQDLRQFNLNVAQLRQKALENEQPLDPQDHIFKLTRAELQKQGVDTESLEGKYQLQRLAWDRWIAYDAAQKKDKPGPLPSYQINQMQDVAGNPMTVWYDRRNPTNFGVITDQGMVPGFLPAEANPTERVAYQAGLDSIANLRTAVDTINDVEKFGGLAGTTTAIKLRNLFGDWVGMPITPEQRQVIFSNRNAVMSYIKEKSGVQFSDRERVYMEQAFPQTINTKEDFIAATVVVAGSAMASLISKQYPQMYQKVDMTKYTRQLREGIMENVRAGRRVRIPTYQEYLTTVIAAEQASGNNLQVIRGANGIILGVR